MASLADDLPTSKERSKKHRMNRITNITTWAECFCAYIAVLSERAQSHTQDLLAYMSLIIHAARQYKGLEWLTYDSTFGQQAVNNPQKKWSTINTSLWTTIFCNASPQEHCPTCLSLDHMQSDCSDAPPPKNAKPTTLNQPVEQHSPPSQICIRFNIKGCSSASCTYRHICLECHGVHHRSGCPLLRRPQPCPSRYSKDHYVKRHPPESSFHPHRGDSRSNA